jgi:hypothetical protein
LSQFDHAQRVAAPAAWCAAEFIHQLPHQVDSPAADTKFLGIHLGHGVEVERFALIMKAHLQGLLVQPALDLDSGTGPITMSMTDDVGECFPGGKNDGVNVMFFKIGDLANGFHKGSGHWQHSGIAGNGQGPGRILHGHALSPVLGTGFLCKSLAGDIYGWVFRFPLIEHVKLLANSTRPTSGSVNSFYLAREKHAGFF